MVIGECRRRVSRRTAALREFLSQFGSTSFMGIPLKGQWWIPFYYLMVLLAGNIAGEELWWRGYLLPR